MYFIDTEPENLTGFKKTMEFLMMPSICMYTISDNAFATVLQNFRNKLLKGLKNNWKYWNIPLCLNMEYVSSLFFT